MSCGKLKLINYPNLSKVIIDRFGNGSIKSANLFSVVKTDEFAKALSDNDITDVEEEITKNENKVISLLEDTYEKLSLRKLTKFDLNDASFLGSEESPLYRIGVSHVVHNIYTKHAAGLINGNKHTIKEYYYNEVKTALNDIYRSILSASGTNIKTVKSEFLEFRKANASEPNLLQLSADYFAKYFDSNSKDYLNLPDNVKNRYALLREMFSTYFIKKVIDNKDIANIVKGEEAYQYLDESELGGYVDENDENFSAALELDSIDASTQLWNLSIGEYTKFDKHISDVIKYQIKSIPNLLSTAVSTKKDKNGVEEKDANGNTTKVYDNNNDTYFGFDSFMDETFVKKQLFVRTNKTNVDLFVESIKTLAERNTDNAGFIYLYDILRGDKYLANQYFMTFANPIMDKVEALVDEKNLTNRKANKNNNPEYVIATELFQNTYNMLDGVNVTELNNDLAAMKNLSKLPSYDSENINELKTLWSKYVPLVTNQNFDNLLAVAFDGDVKLAINMLKGYRNIIATAYKNKLESKNEDDGITALIGKAMQGSIYVLADYLNKAIDVNVALNSQNSLGNQSSDVTNRSYITYLHNVLTGSFSDKSVESYAQQKFVNNQYKYNNLLVEQPGVHDGIFSLSDIRNGIPQLTSYAKSVYSFNIFNGISDRDTSNSNIYAEMTDNDFLIASLALYNDTIDSVGNSSNKAVAKYFISIPSDAPKIFTISAPRYSVRGIKQNGVINRNHPIFQMFRNIVKQELANMARAAGHMFEIGTDGYFVYDTKTHKPKLTETFTNNEDGFFDTYHYRRNSDGKVVVFDGDKLTGSVFKFKRIRSDVASEANAMFDDMIGKGKIFDFTQGKSIKFNITSSPTNAKHALYEFELSDEQNTAIDNAIEKFITEYGNKATKYLKDNYEDIINSVTGKPFNENVMMLQEFILNHYILKDALMDLGNGNLSFYKKDIDVLKRAKQFEGSGHPYGGANFELNDFVSKEAIAPIKITINGKQKDVVVKHNDKERAVKLNNKFTGAMISNTVGPARKHSIDNILAQLSENGIKLTDEQKKILLLPFNDDGTAHNDAQSYITLDEWIRRMALTGEIQKYAATIDAFTNDTPAEEIDWSALPFPASVQKNFYYDLHYDELTDEEVPRQIKNAEYIIVPKLVKGTELEELYNSMIDAGVDQINTVETVKVAKHNKLTFWDNDGNMVTGKELTKFKKDLKGKKEDFNYGFLYRQQETPNHTKDALNKMSVQIIKKICDNISSPEGIKIRDRILSNYSDSILKSIKSVASEIGVEINPDGSIKLEDDGSIAVNTKVLLGRIKQQAIRQGVDSTILEFFDLNELGYPKYPLFLSKIAYKAENIINGYINAAITRQTIAGAHMAQVSDFGFRKFDKKGIVEDTDLKYREAQEVTINGETFTARIVEVKMPRWSKDFNGMSIADITNDGQNPENAMMIGYRIPTEGKQSIAIFKVVDFVEDAEGSTIILPKEWVHQTGSDFDIDSVYTIFPTPRIIDEGVDFLSRDMFSVTNSRTHNIQSYINYLRYNANGIISKKLQEIYDDNAIFEDTIENATTDLASTISEINNADSNSKSIDDTIKKFNSIAKKNKITTFDEFVKMDEFDRIPKEVINNEIALDMIRLMSDVSATEEVLGTSNFRNLEAENEFYKKEFGENSKVVSSSDILVQLDWFRDATSAIKLKGSSVNFDTLSSISNVVKGRTSVVPVIYNSVHEVKIAGDTVKYFRNVNELKKRFGDANVRQLKDGRILVYHEKFGWSNDNKNINGLLINPYSSQTTAHILDVMKAGVVDNENTYTFGAFKIMLCLGIDFHTAIGFMRQSGMKLIVNNWAKTQSIASVSSANPIIKSTEETILEIAKLTNVEVKDKYFSKAVLDKILLTATDYYDKDSYNDIAEAKGALQRSGRYGRIIKDDVSGKYKIRRNKISDIYDIDIIDILSGKKIPPLDANRFVEAAHDTRSDLFKAIDKFVVIKQFEYLRRIAQKASDVYGAIKTDGYGAKQSFISTYDTLHSINRLYNDTSIFTSNNERQVDGTYGDKRSFISNIFPLAEGANVIERINNMNVKESKYQPLAAFLKYASNFSLIVGSALTPTANLDFLNYVYSFKNSINNRDFKADVVSDYSRDLLSKIAIGRDASPYVLLPITLDINDDNKIKFIKAKLDGKSIDDIISNETSRVIGKKLAYSQYKVRKDSTGKAVEFIKNFNAPTEEEIDAFAELSPAQKLLLVKKLSPEAAKLFSAYTVNLYDSRKANKAERKLHHIYNTGNDTDFEIEHTKFNMAMLNSNPLVRLTAIDIVKYVYIVENSSFKADSIGKLIDNTPLRGDTEGGMDIGAMAEFGLANTITTFSDPSNIFGRALKDQLSYLRRHLNDIKLPNESVVSDLRHKKEHTANNKTEGVITIPGAPYCYIDYSRNSTTQNEGVIAEELDEILNNEEGSIAFVYDKQYKITFAKIGKYVNSNNYILFYFPVTPLSDFEASMDIQSSTIPANNVCSPKNANSFTMSPVIALNGLGNYINSVSQNNFINAKIRELYSKQNGEIKEANVNLVSADEQIAFPAKTIGDTTFTEGIYSIPNGNIVLLTEVSEFPKDKEVLSKLQPTANPLERLSARKLENGIDSVKEATVQKRLYSAVGENSPFGSPIKQAIASIDLAARSSNLSAEKVIKSISDAGINIKSHQSIYENRNIAFDYVGNYVLYEANQLLNRINKFVKTGVDEAGKTIWASIDDPSVISKVVNDAVMMNDFLTVIANVRAFKNKYSSLVDLDGYDFNDNNKELLVSIQDIIKTLDGNTKAITARNKFLEEYVRKNSNNPNVDLGIMKATDFYGDTSFIDYWIQDLAANKNILVQNIITSVGQKVEEGRLAGVRNAREFQNYIAEQEETARREGKITGSQSIIDSVIDNHGKIISANNDNFTKEYNKRYDDVNSARRFYGEDSVEYYKAKHLFDNFRAAHVVSKTKPIELELHNIDGKTTFKGTVTYEQAMSYIENAMFNHGDARIEHYVKYRNITKQISRILNNAPNGIPTDSQQAELDELYRQRNELESPYVPGTEYLGQGEPKDNYDDIIALNNYINKLREIRSAFTERRTKETFETILKQKLDTIASFEIRDAEGNLLNNREELLKNARYSEAVKWIKNNAIFKNNFSLMMQLNSAYLALGYSSHSPISDYMIKYRRNKKYVDEYNMLNGIAITEDNPNAGAEFIKAATMINKDSGRTKDFSIIRARNIDNDVVYKEKFYLRLRGYKEYDSSVADYAEEINRILAKYLDDAGYLATYNISYEELVDENFGLMKLLQDYNLAKSKTKSDRGRAIAKFIEKYCEVNYNRDLFELDADKAKTHGETYYNAWLKTFAEVDEDGELIKDEEGRYIPNYIYTTIKPKAEYEHHDIIGIDEEATKAKKFIREHVHKHVTPYYRQAVNKAKADGVYNEWYKNNHYYNFNTHKMEPVPFWMVTEYTSDDKSVGTYEPAPNQQDSVFKEEVSNPEYNPLVNKYQYGSGARFGRNYDNPDYAKLGTAQKNVIAKIKEVMDKYAWSMDDKRFVAEGYVPSMAMEKPLDAKEALKVLAGIGGFTIPATKDINFRPLEDVTIDKDYEISNEHYHKLIDRFANEKVPLPEKQDGETYEEYRRKYDEAVKYNREIDKKNDENHAAVLNHDWKQVFDSLIINGSRYNAVRLCKSLLYTLDQVLNDVSSLKANNSKLFTNKRMSEDDDVMFRGERNTNTSANVRTYINRLVFEKYKKAAPRKWIQLGGLAASIAGTKYMSLNLKGGIQNVITGSVNILAERFARQYSDLRTWEEAKAEWFASLADYFVHAYDDKAGTLTNGIIKFANAVDFDRLVEVEGAKGGRLIAKRIRSAQFFFNNAGEHYMQNIMLLSMMKTHKLVYDDTDNTYKIKSRESFIRQNRVKVLEEILADNEEKLNNFREYVNKLRLNKQESYKFNNFRDDIARRYILEHLTKDELNKFNKLIESREKEAGKVFDNITTNLKDQFVLENGYAVIKPESNLTEKELAKFFLKVRDVNKKIHGVYDRLGAAKLESEFFGSAFMQYHKHILPGFKKRFRWNGYYNESLDNVEKGMYVSLYDFLKMPIADAYRENQDNENYRLLLGIQNYFKHTFEFLSNFGMYYDSMPEYDKANIRRTLAEVTYIAAAIVAAIAVAGIAGDDDDDNLLYNLAIYHIDRTISETTAYSVASVSEISKLYSSPVSIATTISDVGKILTYGVQMLADGDFLTDFKTGQYAGRNKLEVYITRNIPGLRAIDSVLNLDRNNKYYKLDKNLLGYIPYNNIGRKLFDGDLANMFN